MFDKLDKLIASHEACENDFFRKARADKWTPVQMRSFLPDYYFFIRSFPGTLSCLIANVRDEDSRFFLAQILFSELGSGREEKMHFKLFERVATKVGVFPNDLRKGPLYSETLDLVEGMKKLYLNSSLPRALGAQYALETMALPMIEKLYVGFNRLGTLIKEDCEYFEVHLVEEPQHFACMRECVARYISSEDDWHAAIDGALSLLNLFSRFWSRMYCEIVKLEGEALLAPNVSAISINQSIR